MSYEHFYFGFAYQTLKENLFREFFIKSLKNNSLNLKLLNLIKVNNLKKLLESSSF